MSRRPDLQGSETTGRNSPGHLWNADCKWHAFLIIAKLDRLARNVHFISGLMESKVDFVAVDFPQANRLTVHILAAVAEHEAHMISEHTRVALRAAKQRGCCSLLRKSEKVGVLLAN